MTIDVIGAASAIMLPELTKAIDVEMIRDGGSYAATFGDKNGGRYILFVRVEQIDRDQNMNEIIGYQPPVLIDCDPIKRPRNTEERVHSELDGPATAITWGEARTIMAITKGLAEGLNDWRREWLNQMNHVVTHDGGLPPAIKATRKWRRPPGTGHKS